MKRIVTAFFMAWGMFCAIPCPVRRWDESLRREMLACFPLIGLLTGGVWSVLAVGLGAVRCPLLPRSAVLTAALFLLTGFIHLDGFMDCCDAILSRRSPQERLRILRDPHVGSFAVICFGLLLLLQCSVVYEFSVWACTPWLLLPVSCAARCPSSLFILTADTLPGSGYAHMGGASRCCAAVVVILLSAIALPLAVTGVPAGICAALSAGAAALSTGWAMRQLGGVSGDVSGFGVTIGELCGIAALAVLCHAA